MDDLSSFCCLNPACADLGKRGHGNLTVTARYGPNQSRRMLRCRTCKTRSSERKGTAFERSQLPPDKVVSVLDHVRAGCGVRATSRLTGVSRDTVARYSARAGDRAKDLHDEFVAFSPSDS